MLGAILGDIVGSILENWKIVSVKRPKKSIDVNEYISNLEVDKADKYKFSDGNDITVRTYSVSEQLENYYEASFKAVESKKAVVLKEITFVRTDE